MSKRIIVSNETPNDQGGIIPNNVLDWSRFSKNPIMIDGHEGGILGHWEDIRLEGSNWTALPIFSEIESAREKKQLYEEGNLRSASIGGISIWKKDRLGKNYLNEEGYKVSEKFLVYEISLVNMPSNPDAVTLCSPKCYEEEEILSLNSKIKMAEETGIPEIQEPEKVPGKVSKKEILKSEPERIEETEPIQTSVKHVILATENDNKTFMADLKDTIINGVKSLFASDPAQHIQDEPDGDEPVKKTELPTDKSEIGAVNLEKEQLEKVEACNNSTELEALELGSELPSVIKEAIEKKKSTFQTNLKINKMPELKPQEELAADNIKLAAVPHLDVKIGGENVPSFTELRAEKEGRQVIDRVLNSGGKVRDINAHRTFLHSVLNDPACQAIVDKMRISDQSGNRSIPMASLTDLASRFDNGSVEFMNFRSGKVQGYTTLGASDDLLASPDLIAVEWLSLFLYKLFASANWKSEIPVFGATETSKNKGIIWANINADPAVYVGSRPSNPADYEYDDDAVSLTLIPFYLQPMLWQPLKMAQLRYDQMATGWAQAMTKFNVAIDDKLIYTLMSLIPAASIVKTSGGSFSIAASTDIDAFVLNSAFTGALAKPTLSDILVQGQLFNKQNFPEETKFVTVLDPTMKRYILDDSNTKSLLTRFVNSEGDELVSYERGAFRGRSKIGLYDTATNGIVDPTGTIPATAVSAGMSYIPSQVGIGIGNLDVFMIQDPSKYGYKMSADVRMGAALLRKNGYGVCLYTYGEPGN